MAGPTQTISGLNNDRYMVNNPIWVDIKYIANDVKYVLISIVPILDPGEPQNTIPTRLRLYPDFNRSLYFDLSECIKAFFKRPNHPESIANGQSLGTNYIKAQITLTGVKNDGQTQTYLTVARNFIRGGEESYRTNVTAAHGQVLKESTKIPRWPGYPVAKYIIDKALIQYYSIIPASETVQRKVVGCNPVYIRFLNTQGGYSFWLFEQYTINKKSAKPKILTGREGFTSLGHKIDWTLNVESRVDSEYFQTFRALCESPEVHVWGLVAKAFADLQTAGKTAQIKYTWDRVINPGNTVNTNSYEAVQDFKLKFDLLMPHNSLLTW